jgi:hypothetical protein
MIGPISRCTPLRVAFLGALGIIAVTIVSLPAKAGFYVNVGVPFPGLYPPAPFGYPYPPPYFGYPSPYPYYPAPAYSYYSSAAPAAGSQPSGTAGNSSAVVSPPITYTKRPEFKNSAGLTCREYTTTKTINGSSTKVFGTACQQADGQWRMVN